MIISSLQDPVYTALASSYLKPLWSISSELSWPWKENWHQQNRRWSYLKVILSDVRINQLTFWRKGNDVYGLFHQSNLTPTRGILHSCFVLICQRIEFLRLRHICAVLIFLKLIINSWENRGLVNISLANAHFWPSWNKMNFENIKSWKSIFFFQFGGPAKCLIKQRTSFPLCIFCLVLSFLFGFKNKM